MKRLSLIALLALLATACNNGEDTPEKPPVTEPDPYRSVVLTARCSSNPHSVRDCVSVFGIDSSYVKNGYIYYFTKASSFSYEMSEDLFTTVQKGALFFGENKSIILGYKSIQYSKEYLK